MTRAALTATYAMAAFHSQHPRGGKVGGYRERAADRQVCVTASLRGMLRGWGSPTLEDRADDKQYGGTQY